MRIYLGKDVVVGLEQGVKKTTVEKSLPFSRIVESYRLIGLFIHGEPSTGSLFCTLSPASVSSITFGHCLSHMDLNCLVRQHSSLRSAATYTHTLIL